MHSVVTTIRPSIRIRERLNVIQIVQRNLQTTCHPSRSIRTCYCHYIFCSYNTTTIRTCTVLIRFLTLLLQIVVIYGWLLHNSRKVTTRTTTLNPIHRWNNDRLQQQQERREVHPSAFYRMNVLPLQLQFQSGVSERNDDADDDLQLQNATETNTNGTNFYATITSLSSRTKTLNTNDNQNETTSINMTEQMNIELSVQTLDRPEEIHHPYPTLLDATIQRLQQLYTNSSISIVHDNDIDVELLDNNIVTLNEYDNEGEDDEYIVFNYNSNGKTTSYHKINTIIFSLSLDSNNVQQPESISSSLSMNYITVIIGSHRRVDVNALRTEIQKYFQQKIQQQQRLDGINNDASIGFNTTTANYASIQVQLTPRDHVEGLCGFTPGSVPPVLGYVHSSGTDNSNSLQQPPLLTIVEESLVSSFLSTNNDDDDEMILIGGGGHPNYSCRITNIDVLLNQPPYTIVANVGISNTRNNKNNAVNTIPISSTDYSGDRINGDYQHASNNILNVHHPSSTRTAPYFAIAGPSDTFETELLLNKLNDNNSDQSGTTDLRPTKNVPVLQDGWDAVWDYQQVPKYLDSTTSNNEIISFVGRIGNVRRMARELSFCDLLPPDIDISNAIDIENDRSSALGSTSEDIVYPWRNPVTDTKMAVQLICGKTLCDNTGSDVAIRQIHTGQLVLVTGRTNLQSKNSLRNWIHNHTLDIVVLSYVHLQPVQPHSAEKRRPRARPTATERRRELVGLRNVADPVDLENCLRMKDLYNTNEGTTVNGAKNDIDKNLGSNSLPNETSMNGISSHVVLVDDLNSVKKFTKDLSHLLQSNNVATKSKSNIDVHGTTPIMLIGIDCEWKPTFFLESSRDPQPVLVLQVSLHPLQRVYLFDLQTLLRPMMPQSQPMDKLEKEVSFALQALFESKRLIKVGFHVVNDLRQLAASYPHIPAMQFYNSVIESSTLGKKAIRHTQIGNAREATTSLSRLVSCFIGKPLNKQEQCSDWSKRPLSDEQIEYAALDAAVTPIMVEKMISDLNLCLFEDKPYLGRWENDMSLKTALSSLRFVFVQIADPMIQRKLKARQVVGDPMVVSQSWVTGDVPPKLPTFSETDTNGPYTDIHGVLQIPSVSVKIHTDHMSETIDSMIGSSIGNTKDMCVYKFLYRPSSSFPSDARLEYPHRSGFVEFKDGVVLFVNMQSAMGNRYKSKSYPNEWLRDGKVLTWFLRESDWQRGSTPLAKKLLSESNSISVILFVRMGRTGEFICCGRCRVQDPSDTTAVKDEIVTGYESQQQSSDRETNGWSLMKLHLMLLDWKRLQSSSNFQSLLVPTADPNTDSDDSVFIQGFV